MAPDTGSPPDPVTHRRVLAIAVPVVVSNATVPLQGAIDTAIIGNQGSELLLAAVVLGATALTLLFTAFNFLQMGASGLTAEALGAGDARRVVNTLLRALIVARWKASVASCPSRTASSRGSRDCPSRGRSARG